MPLIPKFPNHALLDWLAINGTPEQKLILSENTPIDVRRVIFKGLEDPFNPLTGEIDMEKHERNHAKVESQITEDDFEAFIDKPDANGRTFKEKAADPKELLLQIDVQFDFICGSLPVKGAYKTLALLSRLQKLYEDSYPGRVFYTADWHPEDSVTFVDNHRNDERKDGNGKGLKLFDKFDATDNGKADGKVIKDEHGNPVQRTAWPRHCVKGSQRAQIALKVLNEDHVLRKSQLPNSESYSGIFDDLGNMQLFDHGKYKGRSLVDVFKAVPKFQGVSAGGEAADFCDLETCKHLKQENVNTTAIADAMHGVFRNTMDLKEDYIKSGVGFIEPSLFEFKAENNVSPKSSALSNKLQKLADKAYEDNFAIKEQIKFVRAFNADFKGINEVNLDKKILEQIAKLQKEIAGESKNKLDNKQKEKRQEVLASLNLVDNKLILRPAHQRRWRLNTDDEFASTKGSIISIDSDATVEDVAETHKVYNLFLGHNPWIKKQAETDPTKLNQDKPLASLKNLGLYGKNTASDPIIYVQDEHGVWKVLAITRPTGEKAFPGGLSEDRAKDVCLEEFIEEVLSGSLFKSGYDNCDQATSLARDVPNFFKDKVEAAIGKLNFNFSEQDQSSKDENSKAIKQAIIKALMQGVHEGVDIDLEANLEAAAEIINSQPNLSDFEKNHLLVNLKCKLFEHLLNDDYLKIKDFIFDKLIKLPAKEMRSDPRASEAAFPETNPMTACITQQELKDVLKSAGVGMKAGDDAVDVQLVDLKDMGSAYADHTTLLLESLKFGLEHGKIKEDAPGLIQDIAAIEEVLNRKK